MTTRILKAVVAIAFALCLLCPAALAEDVSTITAQGTCKVEDALHRTCISFEITIDGETLQEAQTGLFEAISSARTAIEEVGTQPEDIHISGGSVEALRSYGNSKIKRADGILGYCAKMDVEALLPAGANVDSVAASLVMLDFTYLVELKGVEESNADCYDAALCAALEQARHNAEVLAKAAGKKPGGLLCMTQEEKDGVVIVTAEYALQ